MKIIHFFSDSLFKNLGQPVPIKTLVPTWYRLAEDTFTTDDGTVAPGLKKCAPFLDSMISGYAFVTPFDIEISRNDDGSLKIVWDGPEPFHDFIIERDHKQGSTIPRPAGHLPNHLAFSGKWGWKTPKGWSTLVVAPLNRFDLPWTITSGIIDSDEFNSNGNLPFFLREDFVGVVPKGTLIAQLIPVKRAAWHHVPNNVGKRYLNELQGRFIRTKGHSYKKDMWTRKKFD